jgi:integrase
MGRKRKRDKHLPARVYLDHGTYWFRPKVGKPVNLGRDLADALTRYASIIGAQWSGRTLGDVIDRYRLEVLPTKGGKTQKDQGPELDRLKVWCGHMMPHSLTKQLCYKYIDRRVNKHGKKVPVAARHEISLLGHVFEHAIKWGVTGVANPVRDLDYGKRKGKRRQVTPDEVEAVKALCSDERIRLAIDLAMIVGQRRGDLLTLNRSQFTDKGIRFGVSKTQESGVAQIDMEWSDELREIMERSKRLTPHIPNDYIIRTRKGRPYTGSGFYAIWQRLMAKHVKNGGKHFTFNDLRSVSADAAPTVEEARDRLGHTSTATTQRWYRRAPTKAKPAR